MPTVLRFGANRIFFYSREHPPPHVHVESSDCRAVFELRPVRLVRSRGYTRRQLSELREVIVEHRFQFLRRWHDHFHG